eukprot:TRINITY_DN115350_c0_g1_i1.p1 TRINITY_DN115350_c0_g1~~TRINITY_DN115350_c0_g1_i1.p1  ORF type:complete len:242 (+),score=107.94 TRINITY_DN115350_c0_g1_i1:81-806(+)
MAAIHSEHERNLFARRREQAQEAIKRRMEEEEAADLEEPDEEKKKAVTAIQKREEEAPSLFFRLYPKDAKKIDYTLNPLETIKDIHGACMEMDFLGARGKEAIDVEMKKQAEEAAKRLCLEAPPVPVAPAAPAAAGQAEDLKKALLEALGGGGMDALFGGSAQTAPAAPAASAATPASVPQAAGEDFSKLSIKELKKRITEAGGQVPAGCTEKAELVSELRRIKAGGAAEHPDAKKARTFA